MKKLYLKIMTLVITSALLAFSFALISTTTNVYADEITADFEIDPELWKALTEGNTFDYDTDKDSVVTIEEFSSSYGMQIDCKDSDIKDWSALSLATEWKYISIKNYNGTDLSILNQLPKLYEVILEDCTDFNNITGLETLTGLSKLTIESNTEIDLSIFVNYPALVELDVTAPSFAGYEELANINNLDKLALSGDTCEGIEKFPDKTIVESLSVSFEDFSDGKIMELATKQSNVKALSVADCNITSLSWLDKMNRLFYLDIRDNMCRDIRTLLEYKNLRNMDLYLKGNVWAPDTEDLLAKTLLNIKDSYTIQTGDYVYLEGLKNPDWCCDIIGDLDFTIADDSLAYIRANSNHVYAIAPGETILRVSNGTDVNLEYKITTVGSPVETNTPKPTDSISAEPPAWVGVTVGDVNRDKKIDAEDALMVLKHAAKIITLDSSLVWAADVDISYGVDATDALNILKYAAHIIPSFDEVVIGTYPPAYCGPTESIEPTKQPTDYDNSFVAIAETTEKINFTKEDFSSVNAVDLYVAQMLKTDTGYRYELIIYLEDEGCSEEILSSAMETVSAYDNISAVERNEYCERNSIINLNYDEYELKVGESISLYINEYNPFFGSEHAFCLVFKLKEDKLNGSEISDETFAEYGISSWCKGNDFNPTEFYSSSRNPNISIQEDLTYVVNDQLTIAKVHELSQLPEVESVAILFCVYPTGSRSTEFWTISDDSIATMVLSGGEPINYSSSSITKLYQMATITALAPGEVTVSVTKQGWGAKEATGICKIKIVE